MPPRRPLFGANLVLPSLPRARAAFGLAGSLALLLVLACSSSPTAPSADFTISLGSTTITVIQGANGTVTVTVGRTNFTESVTLSLAGAPTGVTGTFDPASTTGTTSTLTLAVGASVTPGNYSLTINGSGAPGTKSASLTLTVAPTPDFTVAASPDPVSVQQGGNGTVDVTLGRTNFTGAVTLSLTGAPTGVTGSFNPAAPTGGTSTLTLAVDAAVATGDYVLTVEGTGTPGSRSVDFTLTVIEPPPPDYALSLSPAALSINQGASATTTVTLTRTNFTEAVTLSLGGAPAGVTGTFDPAAPTGTSSTLTVNVDGSVALGTYELTVDGTGSPGDRSTALSLTVTNAPDYSLSLSPTGLSINQGASATTTVTLTRTNFTGAVTLSLGGAPAGVTGTFDPTAPTGTSSTLTVNVGGSVAAGTYNLTVDGAASAGARSTALSLTVNAAGGSTATLDFSSCAIDEQPAWFASKDGAGPWTVVSGAGGVFSFTVAGSTGGYAYALDQGVAGSNVLVFYGTKAELTSGTTVVCDDPTLKTVSGSATGIAATDFATVSLGGGSAFPSSAVSAFQLMIQSGTHDLVGYRRSLIGGADAAIIRRDLDIMDGGSLAAMDFNGVEAFAPASAAITITGAGGGEMVAATMGYQVGATCSAASLYSGLTGSSFTAMGIPAAQQRASDFHALGVSASSMTSFRFVTEYFNALANRNVALGAALPAPTVTSLGGSYERLQAVFTLPAEYNGQASLFYDDDDIRSAAIFASIGYLGGTNVTLAMPDFSGLAGWSDTWAPASGGSGSWVIGGTGSTAAGSVCTEGARAVTASRIGTY